MSTGSFNGLGNDPVKYDNYNPASRDFEALRDLRKSKTLYHLAHMWQGYYIGTCLAQYCNVKLVQYQDKCKQAVMGCRAPWSVS